MVKNTEIIEAVKSSLPGEHADRLQGVTDGVDMLTIFENYPSTKNAFIEGLQNKVVKSVIFSKVYNNPLKMLKKGTIGYGDSIEELFVQMAQAKNFGEHWDATGSDEADLIRELKPKVTSLYATINYDKKFKTSISDKMLRKAFVSETGLSNLVNNIVSSITNAIEYHEFKTTKDSLKHFVETLSTMDIDGKPVAIPTSLLKKSLHSVQVADIKELAQKVRQTAGDMSFMTDKFNVAGETTFCKPNELVFVTSPATVADLDVNVLATAFNVSSADLSTRIILVDELPTAIAGAPAFKAGEVIQGILMDKELIQIWDTFQGAGTFYNPSAMVTNHFANREGIFATCLFANCAVFYK